MQDDNNITAAATRKEDNSNNYENNDNITTVNISLKLTTNLYKAAQAISTLCVYDNFEDYLRDVIVQDVKMELDGGGRLVLTMVDDNKKKLLAGID